MGDRFLSLAGSVRVWFTSLHVQAVMPVTLAKRCGIFIMFRSEEDILTITNACNKSIVCQCLKFFSCYERTCTL